MQFLIEPAFDFAGTFAEGLARIKTGNKWGFIDQAGNLTIGLQFDVATNFHDGLAAVRIGEVWGFINRVGEMQIPLIYKHVRQFSEGKLPHSSWQIVLGFINRLGEPVIDPQFDSVGHFRYGRCLVTTQTEIAYIDHEGARKWSAPPIELFVSDF